MDRLFGVLKIAKQNLIDFSRSPFILQRRIGWKCIVILVERLNHLLQNRLRTLLEVHYQINASRTNQCLINAFREVGRDNQNTTIGFQGSIEQIQQEGQVNHFLLVFFASQEQLLFSLFRRCRSFPFSA